MRAIADHSGFITVSLALYLLPSRDLGIVIFVNTRFPGARAGETGAPVSEADNIGLKILFGIIDAMTGPQPK